MWFTERFQANFCLYPCTNYCTVNDVRQQLEASFKSKVMMNIRLAQKMLRYMYQLARKLLDAIGIVDSQTDGFSAL